MNTNCKVQYVQKEEWMCVWRKAATCWSFSIKKLQKCGQIFRMTSCTHYDFINNTEPLMLMFIYTVNVVYILQAWQQVMHAHMFTAYYEINMKIIALHQAVQKETQCTWKMIHRHVIVALQYINVICSGWFFKRP